MFEILIVDDEKKLASFLLRGLVSEGYHCTTADSIDTLQEVLAYKDIDLIILDRMLGSDDSIEIIPALRQRHRNLRILMLSALHDVDDKVAGLRLGADDYLGKPFDFEELLARISALLRREISDKEESSWLEHGHLRMHKDNHKAFIRSSEVLLTRLEFQLVLFLLNNPERALSRERIISKVWSQQEDTLTNIVDVYIRRIRSKFDQALAKESIDLSSGEFIETVRGIGYRLGPCR